MILDNLIDGDYLKENQQNLKKIFMYRICGTGMGAAACLLKEKGFNVEGGDVKFAPPMGDYLRETGIPLHDLNVMSLDYLKEFDLIIVGNVVSGKSDVARSLEKLGVPFISFPSALGALVLDDVNVVGVCGTHGKTTTTYLLTQIFEKLNFDIGYFIGGVIEGRNSARLGDGSYFFIEADEYDSAYFEKISKFRKYSIDHLVLTSLEFDHADIFSDLEDIKDQFRAVIPNISTSFILNEDYPAINQLFDEFKEELNNKKLFYYGDSSSVGPKVLQMDENGTIFELNLESGKEAVQFATNLVGKHNILNLTVAIIFAYKQGVESQKIVEVIKKLDLLKRRQEERGFYKGALVIDDFAHHPRAVELTCHSISVKYKGKRIVVILEPNSATARSSIFQNEFTSVLADISASEVVLVKPALSTTVVDTKDLDVHKMAKTLVEKGKNAFVAENLEGLRTKLNEFANSDTVFLILSNGTCLGLWESDFKLSLEK